MLQISISALILYKYEQQFIMNWKLIAAGVKLASSYEATCYTTPLVQ